MLRIIFESNHEPAVGRYRDSVVEDPVNHSFYIYDCCGTYVTLDLSADSDADIQAIAALTPADDDIIQRKSGAWTNRTPAEYKIDLDLVKADVGLGAVDNTSDADKPVSTAQQSAIDAKVEDSIINSHTTVAPSGNAVFDALALKQDALGFTPENIANKDTDTALAANSDTKYPSQHAVKAYVDNAVTGLLDFKGATDASSNPNYPAASKGDTYVVSVAGKVGGGSGKSVDVGDVYLATADNAGGTEAAVGTSWVVMEHNLVGALLAANNLSDLTNAATARSNLGVAIGSQVQAWDADLDTLAGLTATTDNFIVSVANAWASRTPAQVRTTLGLVIGTNVQAWDADLDTWATKTPPSGTPVGTTDTQTLSSKRINPRVVSITSNATPGIDQDATDQFNITAQAADITSMTSGLTGTPVSGQRLIIRIKDDGTIRNITWGASFVSRGATLPTATVAGKYLYVGLIYNGTAAKWDCVAVAQEV